LRSSEGIETGDELKTNTNSANILENSREMIISMV